LVRVTFVNLFYPPDVAASGTFVSSLAEHRASMGDDVTVVCGTGVYVGRVPSAAAARSAGSTRRPRLIRLWTPSLGKSTAVRRLGDYLTFLVAASARVLTLPRQDVVVAMTSPPFAHVAAVAHRIMHPRTRVVFWCHDVYPDAAEEYETIRRGGSLSRVLRRLQRWLLSRTDHVVALDDAMLRRVLSQYAPTGGPTGSVIPNWEPIALFPSDEGERRWPGYGEPELAGRNVVLYLGNLGYGHPIATIVQAAQALGGDGDVSFLFVGGGVRYPELAGEARLRSLDDVVLRDYVAKDTTPSVLVGALAILISLDDGSLGIMSPCKLHGGLAMGRPVIYVGPAGTNVDEAIAAYRCGFSLRQGDAAGLVDAVRRLRDDPELREEQSRNARKAFEEAYSDARTLPQFDELFDRLSRAR
jgi:colanic acid biosynthesis glycosyl transferase WcaI